MRNMILNRKDELAIIRLKQIINFIEEVEDKNCFDKYRAINIQEEIKTLVKELSDYYGKLDYLKYAY